MRANSPIVAAWSLVAILGTPAFGQGGANTPPADTANDPIRAMVSRLELEKYKATVKGLTQFGDRRQGTERNRKAVDWIEAQLNLPALMTGWIEHEQIPDLFAASDVGLYPGDENMYYDGACPRCHLRFTRCLTGSS